MTEISKETNQVSNKKMTWSIFFVVLLLIALGVAIYAWHAERYPETDDSYVQANIINIAPQVNGLVTSVLVKNQQHVKKDDVLVTIDPQPYQYAVQNADAVLKLAQQQAKRILPLIKTGQAAPSEGDTIQAQIEEASAALNQAKYDVDHTVIRAPADGTVANLTVRSGDTVMKGYNLFSVVEQSEFWIDANFKETQLKRIQVGQLATIKIDMYPTHTFTGTVVSINPGSGSIFSLLPPENATGNWVKVTQRVPVKILLTHLDPHYPLLVGTSAVTRIDTTSP
jgi:membrane fusion protein (multidrug efflux system)